VTDPDSSRGDDVVRRRGLRPRIEYLDGLRAGSALFVLFHHAMMMAYPVALGVYADGLVGTVFGWAIYGHFGVTVFIVLAGYSLALGIAGRDGDLPGGTWAFLKRRARRILPPYWIALAMTMVLVTVYIGQKTGTHWDLSTPTDYKGWILDTLLLQDVGRARDVAYTFWSVSVEFHIYLLLPIILMVRRRSTWAVAIAVGAGIGLAGIGLALTSPRYFERFFPSYYLLFALAVGACVAVHSQPRWLGVVPWKSVGAVLVAFILGVCVTKPYMWVADNFYWVDVLFGLAVICFVVSMSSGSAPRTVRVFSWTPLASAGIFSYSLYLIHAPLLQVLWQAGIEPRGWNRAGQLGALWLVACPLIILFSYGFYRLAEKPFQSTSTPRHRLSRRHSHGSGTA
jgi:peptidoglycan/LPS O-acetylase OafA/YrhL